MGGLGCPAGFGITSNSTIAAQHEMIRRLKMKIKSKNLYQKMRAGLQ